jgi:AcrR family transcriptional regulator
MFTENVATRRAYRLNRRAQRREETRQRIVQATFELHRTLGPARTTISAIAERAGVQRLTVYRHFPDELSLFRACAGLSLELNPPPDPAPWRAIGDPEARLRAALAALYAYYAENDSLLVNVRRDAELLPVLRQVQAERTAAYFAEVGTTLAAGWEAHDTGVLRAALAHALDFGTWHSLVRQQRLTDEQAVELMVAMVRCGTGSG